jgi:hypothetical protein
MKSFLRQEVLEGFLFVAMVACQWNWNVKNIHSSLPRIACVVFMVSVSQVTAQYFEYTWHHWCSDTQGILQVLQTLLAGPQSAILVADQDQALRLTCERWMLCLKVLRRMLVHGFQSDARSVQVCFTNMLKAIKLSCVLISLQLS